MTKILLTAFEPYDRWSENSSWLTLIELTKWLDTPSTVVTRRYPVDLQGASDRLQKDLREGFDYAIHLGQSPGSPLIKLESTGLNLRTDHQPLVPGGPAAYRSPLELLRLHDRLVGEGIPAQVSNHARVYLCNAVLYLSQYFSERMGIPTRSMFIHLPLAPHQVARSGEGLASCDIGMMARAVFEGIRWVEAFPSPAGVAASQGATPASGRIAAAAGPVEHA